MSAYNDSQTVSLDYLSREKIPTVLPTIICIGILMVIGLIGNIFVVIVFGCKMRKQSTYRHFILVLAVYDLTACSLGMPALIYEMVNAYKFYSGIGCRLLRYGYYIIAGGSSLTHALVGIDRYRRICRPAHTQMSVQTARTVSFITLVFCLIGVLPVLFMFDAVIVETRVANITGYDCDVSPEYTNTAFPILYSSLLSLYLLAIFVLLIVLYSMIGYTLYRRKKIIEPTRGYEGASNTNAHAIGKHRLRGRDNGLSRGRLSVTRSDPDSISNIKSNNIETISRTTDRVASIREPNIPVTNVSAYVRKVHARETVSRKMTVTTFIITLVFIISFAPIQVLELLTILNEDIETGMSYTHEVLYRFANHTYAINNMANPLVYIFMDIMFRRQCLNILHMIKCKILCKG